MLTLDKFGPILQGISIGVEKPFWNLNLVFTSSISAKTLHFIHELLKRNLLPHSPDLQMSFSADLCLLNSPKLFEAHLCASCLSSWLDLHSVTTNVLKCVFHWTFRTCSSCLCINFQHTRAELAQLKLCEWWSVEKWPGHWAVPAHLVSHC